MQIIKQRVERLLAENAMSKGELARRMGVRQTWISRILRMSRQGYEFQPRTVGRLARALHVEVADIARERSIMERRVA